MQPFGSPVNNDYDLAAGATVYNTTPDAATARWLIFDVVLGDGTKNLDGNGGDFTLALTIDGVKHGGAGQIRTIDAAEVRARFPTEPLIVPAGVTVTIAVTSPNGADTDVDVTVQAYDVADVTDDIATAVIASLRAATPAVLSGVTGQKITAIRGDTWSITPPASFVGDISDRNELYFTVKLKANDDADSSAIVKISESNGLEILNGADASATATRGSITVADELTGDLTIELKGVSTADIPPGKLYEADLQVVREAGADDDPETLWLVSDFNVTKDVTRAVA